MDDFIYLEDGVVKVSDMAMEIPEFKDFKRYDSSTNKVYFGKAMSYIYFVYKVFGEEKSYIYNLPLAQRKKLTVQHHTGTYKKIADFDDNDWVQKCVAAYLKYSRTANEKLFDALKDDIDRFIDYVQNVPHTFKKKIVVYRKDPEHDDEQIPYDIEIDVPFVEGRIKALTQASELDKLFREKLIDVNKDAKKKKGASTVRLMEDTKFTSKIPLTTIPTAQK